MEPDRARVRPIGAGVHRHLTPAIVALLILAGVARGALSGVLPLYDTTEGRYGSVAVAMHDTGNLVTPVLRVGGVPAPYWGKPPLAFWLMDASFHLFGVNEFGARFPALLCGALMLWLVFRGGKAIGGTETGLLSALVLASSILFLVIAGAVTLDMAASLCVTGIVISYLMIGLLPEGAAGAWKVLFFVSIGIGMLAKGPVVLVLGLGPVLLHGLVTRRFRPLRRLPWLGGVLLSLAICAPWYLLAERATPGFLRYYFINEHLLRYQSPEYGDLYGAAHVRPRGTIWLFLVAGLMPWPLLLLGKVPAALRALRAGIARSWNWEWLLVFTALLPAAFFTAARSVVPSYVLPGFGAAAILIALGWRGSRRSGRPFRWGPPALLPLATLLVLFAAWYQVSPDLDPLNSSREAIAAARRTIEGGEGRIVVLKLGEPSMDFYGRDRILWVRGKLERDLRARLEDGVTDAYLLRSTDRNRLDPRLEASLFRVASIGSYDIYRESHSPREESARGRETDAPHADSLRAAVSGKIRHPAGSRRRGEQLSRSPLAGLRRCPQGFRARRALNSKDQLGRNAPTAKRPRGAHSALGLTASAAALRDPGGG